MADKRHGQGLPSCLFNGEEFIFGGTALERDNGSNLEATYSLTITSGKATLYWLSSGEEHIISEKSSDDSELTEASLNDRAFCKPESIEEKVSRNIEYELLHKAISKLPEIQRRRLLLYFFGEMTYEQIAALEGCTKRAVKFSVDIAIEKLKKDFGIF